MPYYVINELPVFISDSKEKILKEQALGDKSAEFHIRSFAESSKEVQKRETIIYQFLRVRYDDDRQKFYNDWVEFDIEGKAASKNATDLIYDYCQYYHCGTLHDLRDHREKIEQEHMEDVYYYPLGKILLANFNRKGSFIKRLFGGSSYKSIRLKIDVDRVYRLKGVLTNFEVHSEDFQLICSKEITLIPRSFAFIQEHNRT